MELKEINRLLFEGKSDHPGLFTRLEALRDLAYVFEPDFGLKKLPEEPGILLIRGPRQYGKSTWLESKIKETILHFGPGSAYYLNGDELRDEQDLFEQLHQLTALFSKTVRVNRIFIDEITALQNWEKALKRAYDQGILKKVLVVTTGSKSVDLRKGSERLPGRRGKLDRTVYFFTPIDYQEFKKKCGAVFGEKTVLAYLLCGGCPIAANELAQKGKIPEYVIAMIRDWMIGECTASGRDRSSLSAVINVVLRNGGNPVGHSHLAREAGLANNTVAAGYVELLQDLMVIVPSYAWDHSKNISIKRKPCKFPFINLLAAVAWYPGKIRTLKDFELLVATEQSKFLEWLVAQELWRRKAIETGDFPEDLPHWRSQDHEIDFVDTPQHLIEVKRGSVTPVEFSWFPKIFPHAHLDVVNQVSTFQTKNISGVLMRDYLLLK